MLYLRKVFGLGLTLVLLILMACAQFSGGSGTQSNPWQVSTARQLNNVRNYLGEAHDDKYFIQTADIDLGVEPWNEGEGWLPIGSFAYDDDNNTGFYGHYDGNRKLVSNLFINRPDGYYQGLFGYSSGKIQNLGIEDGNVSGREDVGALVGFNEGIIENCYSNCNVNGDWDIGGIVGINEGTLNKCYSRGNVGGEWNIGGLVGLNWNTILDCYWDIKTSDQTTTVGGKGRTTEEMTSPHAAHTYANWDWRVWKPDVNHVINDGYPIFRSVDEKATQAPEAAVYPVPADQSTSIPLDYLLQWQVGFSKINTDPPSGFKLWLGTDNPPSNIIDGIDLGYTNEFDPTPYISANTCYYWRVVPYNQVGEASNMPIWSFCTYETTNFGGGAGTEQDPWKIANAEHLYNLKYYLGKGHTDKYFNQIADIDLGLVPWNQGEGWVPIGEEGNEFYGHYNGNDYIISNLLIKRPHEDDQGLFGISLGHIQNLGLDYISVAGGYFSGGLVGKNEGQINNCYISGSVSGKWYTGGMVGYNYDGTLINCYSDGHVNGDYDTGGLVGWNEGRLINCYSKSSINGYWHPGGLVGYNSKALLRNCYSTGSVSGVEGAGGLIGNNGTSMIENCYWDMQKSGQSTSDGGEGRNTDQMTFPHATNTYVNWDWRIWEPDVDHSVNSGYPFFRQVTQVPEAAANPIPADQIASVPVDYILQWQEGLKIKDSGPVSGFKLWLGTDNPPSNIINGLDLGYITEFDPKPYISMSNIYYWRIVPYNQIGEATNVPVWSFGFIAEFGGGSGTEQNPWQVATVEHLDNVRNYLSKDHENKYFIQTADIDLGMAPWNQNEGWEPIGTEFKNRFCGEYNGNGKVISNLFINRPNSDYQGLFGCSSGHIQNLGIKDVSVNGNKYTGGLVGQNSGTINNCYSAGSIDGDDDTGGLVGQNSGMLSNCYSTGSLNGNRSTGGLVGYNSSGGAVSDCYSNASVSGYYGTGGLVGSNFGIFSNCHSNGNVNGEIVTGGFVGWNYEDGKLTSCYSTSNVSGHGNTGGLAGSNSKGTISNCYSTGCVTGKLDTGGVVGWNSRGIVNFCYSTSSVNGNRNVGGLVGKNSDGKIKDCYWNTLTSGQKNSDGGEGRTTREMVHPHALNTFMGWNFRNVWVLDTTTTVNDGYPFLKFQKH